MVQLVLQRIRFWFTISILFDVHLAADTVLPIGGMNVRKQE